VFGILTAGSALGFARYNGVFGGLLVRSAQRLGTHGRSTLINFFLAIVAVNIKMLAAKLITI
jgi:hypothetical protein